jgi:hypothetical protein
MKKSISPPTYESWNTSAPTYKNEFKKKKQDKSPLKQFWKIVIKNEKNQIVLDLKLVVLRSEPTIWNALVHIFFL